MLLIVCSPPWVNVANAIKANCYAEEQRAVWQPRMFLLSIKISCGAGTTVHYCNALLSLLSLNVSMLHV